jgi:ATP-dependent RNA helicase RhlE
MQHTNLSFFHLGIAPKMLEVLERLQFVQPTPVQHQTIPPALEGKDIVGVAQTGTGKTLAFGVPLVQRLSASQGRGLVLVPTRELAIQVDQALRDVMRPYHMSSVVLIGGANIRPQISALQKKPRVIVATPGRLIDHLEQKTVHLKEVEILVLDEADRMLDMGFQPQVERILRRVPNQRQTMLFSATMPQNIIRLATQHMKLPIHVEIAPSGTAAEDVTHELFIIREESKKPTLKLLLNQYRGSVLLFTRTKVRARRITRMVRELHHRVAEIHSDRTMGQRKEAIDGFKSGRHRVLVATDIAARGLDVTGIELVINYDLPDDIENYVHRIGRTGRAGTEGHAISLATPTQGADVEQIEKRILSHAIFREANAPRAPHAGASAPDSADSGVGIDNCAICPGNRHSSDHDLWRVTPCGFFQITDNPSAWLRASRVRRTETTRFSL